MYDLVIRDGVVIDGSGAEGARADVAVTDGRIVQVGKVGEKGREELSAEGRVVTPGFIDGHTHLDAQVFWDSLGANSCWHGVTTAVMGNCGFTLAPSRETQRELVIRNLERAEDISAAAMKEGINWSFETFPEYMDAVDRLPKSINYVANIGHSALRTFVMGERAFESTANEDDLNAMKGELRSALDAGAIGFTTSRSSGHETSDDRPVASRLASWDEVAALVGVLGEVGGRVFELSLESAMHSADPKERRDATLRLQELAVSTGVTTMFGVVPTTMGGKPAAFALLDMIERTNNAGGRMFAQTHSRGITNVLSFRTRLPFDALPEWRAVRDRPLEEQRTLLSDPGVRATLVASVHEGRYERAAKGGEPRQRIPFEQIRIMDHVLPPHRTVAEVARERHCDPVEAMIELALASDFEQLFFQPLSLDDEGAIRTVMEHPHGVMTFSDSGAHVSQIADSSIQTYLLAHWVRQEQVFTLEEAIRMVTSSPANAWGFTDRGYVREGFVADLNILDPERVVPDLPVVVNDLPAGAQRLSQSATGIDATVVAGQVAFRSGEHAGVYPGRLLRRTS